MSPTKSKPSNTARAPELSTPLQFLKGVGPARSAYFARKGLISILDALYYFPRRHEDRRKLFSPADLAAMPEGTMVTVAAEIRGSREIPLRNRRQKMLEVRTADGGSELQLTWFNSYKGLKEKFPAGAWGIFTGALKRYRGLPQIAHPDAEILDSRPDPERILGKSLHWGRIAPIYPRTEGLSQKLIREVLSAALEAGLPLVEDLLPEELRARHKLPGIREALAEMHFPKEMPRLDVVKTEDLPPALRRLIFEEFFKFQLVLLMDREGIKPEPGIPLQIRNRLATKLRGHLPYKLTQAQERAIAEILADLQKPTAMNRILQGDVGAGKTLVAFLVAAEAAENGMQTALMAPTEILAEQHFRNAEKLFKNSGIGVGFLAGSLSRAEKQAAHEKIRSGEWSLVIGTHAIIQEAVDWKNFGLAIIDEQHRFGVRQRAYLKEKAPKGKFPHILTMTATPIPRSLALTVFGELAVSTLDELPPGRQPIVTKVLRGSDRERLYALVKREAEAGRQAYIVYPLVNDSDKEGMEKLKSVEAEVVRLQAGPLAGLRVGSVHGQMSADAIQNRMRAFQAREFDVLVATTVIEVGVDIPNATVMAVENAERFGLAQLHQLRGRVGRGEHKSYCVLVTESPPPGAVPQANESDEGAEYESPWTRLLVLEASQDGFHISEQDLKLRGPGDFFGTKQSGSPTFQLADLQRDMGLLELARQEARALFAQDPKMEAPEHRPLRAYFQTILAQAAATLKSG